MSFDTMVANLTTRIATEIKALRTLINGNAAGLGALTTTDKTNVVAAINEVNAAIASSSSINDSTTGTSTTWSSSKIDSEIDASVPTWTTLSGKPATFPPTIGTTAATAKAGNYVPSWSEITSKPTTFAPIIGTTGTTAKAGDWLPSWADVSGKPSFAAVAVSGSYADLTGTVPTSALPPLAINEVFTVATQAAMLALTAQRGDMAIRTDNGRTYVLSSDSPTTLADWKEISAAGSVVSVAGKTGTVTLVKADVGLANVDNTSDANKPVSTAQQTALNLKANSADVWTKTDIGAINTDYVALFNAGLV